MQVGTKRSFKTFLIFFEVIDTLKLEYQDVAISKFELQIYRIVVKVALVRTKNHLVNLDLAV